MPLGQAPFPSASAFPGLHLAVDEKHVSGVYRHIGDIIVIRIIGTVEARPPVGTAPVGAGPERGGEGCKPAGGRNKSSGWRISR